MFRKLIGDVGRGLVESPFGTFTFYGDPKGTLAAMTSTRQKLLQAEMAENTPNYETINTIYGIGYLSLDFTRHRAADLI